MPPYADTLEDISRIARTFMEESGLNLVAAEEALRPDLAGFRMYDPPLFAVAAADDPLFEQLRRPEVLGPHFRPPRAWLPEAESVVSYFLPFTDEVIRSNRIDPDWPSMEWMHARIEGQRLIDRLGAHITQQLRQAGHLAESPSIHPDFKTWRYPPHQEAQSGPVNPTSNWSERHVGYVAGLGTFGQSAVFITRRGAAGRLGSVVTSLALAPTARKYDRYDAYCNHCGACIPRCRENALTEGGKDKNICSRKVDASREKYQPHYGCGKCYVAVPCERGAPGKKTG